MNLINLKKTTAFLVAAMLTFSLASCNGGTTSQVASVTSSNATSETVLPDQPTTITDRDGKEMMIPAQVDKIISISPSITETLIHLGLADKLVAIDKYSVGIAGLPENLPAYDIMAPDTESIASLKPDIIFATGMSRAEGDDPFKAVTDLGITMTYIPSATSIEGIKADIRFMGAVTNTSDKAEAIVLEMETEMDAILEKIKTVDQPKTVYFEIYELYSFGKGTFLDEMITMLGAKNILADQESWVKVSEEMVIAQNPDVIFTSISEDQNPIQQIVARAGWDVITAVKNKDVYAINPDSSSHPNEYVVIALAEMAKALYPELF